MPISLTLSDIEVSDRTCQLTIGAMVMAVQAPRAGDTRWAKLLEGFKARFSDISV